MNTKYGIFLYGMILLTSSLPLRAEVTSDEVYSELQAIVRAINHKVLVKKKYSGFEISNAQPLHVYAMATALNEKVAILNDLKGNTADDISRPAFPNGKVQPRHVLDLVKTIQSNMQLLDPNVQFSTTTVIGKQPVDVLRLLLAGNMAIDTLLKEVITPSYPFSMLNRVKLLLESHSNIKAPTIEPELYGDVKTKEVFLVAESTLKIFMTTAYLQFKTKYPSQPYYIPSNRAEIHPVDVFTLTVMNWVLLMDITEGSMPDTFNWKVAEQQKLTPAYVYAAYQQVIYLSSHFLLTNVKK